MSESRASCSRRRAALSVAALFVVALVLELLVFNLRHWETASLSPESVEPSSTVTRVLGDGGNQTKLTFDLGNADVGSIALRVVGDGKGTTLDFAISDSGQSATAYTIASVSVKGAEREVIQSVHAYGYVKTIVVTAKTPEGSAPAKVSDVRINEPVPLRVSVARLGATLFVLLALFALRPRGVVWGIRHRERPLVAATALAGMVVVTLVGFGYGLEGSAPGYDDPNNVWDEYSQLARSIVDDGKVSLSQEVPAEIRAMDDLDSGEARLTDNENVLDGSARQRATGISEETGRADYKLDAAYFRGSYYVYYGVVPCLAAYVPYYVLSGQDLSNTAACLPALLAVVVLAYLCVELVARRRFPQASSGAVMVAYLGLMLCSGVSYALAAPHLYNVPVLYALAFLMLGSYLLLRAMAVSTEGRRDALAGVGVLALVLTAGCRPQVTLGAFLVGLWYVRWLLTCCSARRRGLVVIAVPIVAVVGGLLWYNQVRFGSPLDFGANYNLTSNDMTLRGHEVTRAVEGTLWYLGAPPRLTGRFPFITPYVPAFGYAGKTIAEPFTFGLPAACPFLLALPSLFAVARESGRRWVRIPMVVLAALCVAVIVFDTEGAGILMRYRLDFGYLAGMAFAGGLLCLDDGRMRAGGARSGAASALYPIIAVLVLLAVYAAVLVWLCETSSHLWSATSPMWLAGYDQLRQVFEAWGAFVS